METMKAAVFEGIETIVVQEVAKPDCPPRGVIVRVEACNICGGDVRNFHQGLRGGVARQIMGHEIAGIVVETDAQDRLALGQRVAIAPDIHCGTCYYCRKGLVNLCENHRMLGTHLPGGFAQYIALPQEVLEHGFITALPDDMSYIQGAFAEKVAGVAACQERCQIQPDDTVVVIGDGPAGCLHLEVARARGAKTVISLARGRKHFAEQFCADAVLDNHDPDMAQAKVAEMTGGIGADVVICAVPSTTVQAQALELVRGRGRVVIYGGAPRDDRRFTKLDSNLIHYKEITVMGAFSYPLDGLDKAVRLIHNGSVHVEKYITKLVPLEGIVDGIRQMDERRVLNAAVCPWM